MQPTPPPDPSQSNYPRLRESDQLQNMREVAVAHRQIVFCVLGQISLMLLNVVSRAAMVPELSVLVSILAVGLLVMMLISVSKLAKALGQSSLLYLILMFVPCVSLIALLHISGNATKVLKSNGIKVGLLGADPNSI